MDDSMIFQVLKDLRKELWNKEDKEHKCGGSLIRCCSVFRCEPCQVQHLRTAHHAPMLPRWWKFHTSPSIIVDAPVEQKEQKEKEKRKVGVVKKALMEQSDLSLDELEKIVKKLRENMKKD